MLSQLVLVLLIANAVAQRNRAPPEFRGLKTIVELAGEAGYDATNIEVLTEDGYSIWMHRLGNNRGPPVMIHHGILLAADSWITRGRQRDLPFLLLEQGFDVWLSNQRGTVYNEYSLKYDRSNPKFWDFSFHEAAIYDLPAFIDTILKIRNEKKLFYIGHSLGTTVLLALLSSKPEYNHKVRAAVLMSPVAFGPTSEELAPLLRKGLDNIDIVIKGLEFLRKDELFSRSEESISGLRKFCTNNSPTQTICLDLFGTAFGEHRTNINKTEWDNFIVYYFAGTSLKTVYHSAQLYQNRQFLQFDYGEKINNEVYGTRRPPRYPVDRVTVPVALFWGANDPLISETSIGRLESELPNVILSRRMPDPRYSHIDLLIGMDDYIVLYPDVIRILQSF